MVRKKISLLAVGLLLLSAAPSYAFHEGCFHGRAGFHGRESFHGRQGFHDRDRFHGGFFVDVGPEW